MLFVFNLIYNITNWFKMYTNVMLIKYFWKKIIIFYFCLNLIYALNTTSVLYVTFFAVSLLFYFFIKQTVINHVILKSKLLRDFLNESIESLLVKYDFLQSKTVEMEKFHSLLFFT